MYGERVSGCYQDYQTAIVMSLEDLLQEHIKALHENTQAIKAYTKALQDEGKTIEVEHTKDSACRFCGITYKTLQSYLENGMITPSRRKDGRREYFKQKDLIALCESQSLFSGEYGKSKQS